MRRNSVTPLASPEPTKKPRINSFEEHVAAAASAAHPICMPQEVPAQLPGQVGSLFVDNFFFHFCVVVVLAVLWLLTCGICVFFFAPVAFQLTGGVLNC